MAEILKGWVFNGWVTEKQKKSIEEIQQINKEIKDMTEEEATEYLKVRKKNDVKEEE